MFEFKPDYEQTKERINAFWHNEILDRPVTMLAVPKPPAEQISNPPSGHADIKERWYDIQYQVDLALALLKNQVFMGDALPIVYPNLGPEVFSAFYGCPLHFSETTSWTDPILEDWRAADKLALDWNHPDLLWLLEMTDALLEVGRDRFITGMPDWHSGGDAIAAFRDPQNLAIDMLEHTQDVQALLARIEGDYFRLYDLFYAKLRAAGLPITSWTPLIYDGKHYIPCNDFSIMISKKMYAEVFLPGITRECQFLDRSIYHLDGPGALRHLDSILAIPELNALQWVPGAGSEEFQRWVWVYQKVQKAGKGIQVNCRFIELPLVMEALDPNGLFLLVSETPDVESAQAMLKELENWTSQKRKA